MTDITDILHALSLPSDGWTRQHGLRIARTLGSHLNTPITWDEGAGEDWVQIVVEATVRVLVGVRWPIVVVRDADVLTLRKLIPNDVSILVVSDMDEPELFASDRSLVSTFGDRAHSAALCPSGFSATDLWFATV